MIKPTLKVLAIALTLAACNKTESESAPQTELANASEVKISVPTVQCGSCQANVEGALQELEGVTSAKVDLETKIALVSFDETKLNLSALENAVAMSGYDANSVKRDSTAYAELDACCKLPEDRDSK